jgi:MFS transporter, ACS family, glucarate transporter
LSAASVLPAIRIRWRIFGFLFGFGLIAYLQQKSITIAAERMMPELHLSQLQISFLSQAFVVGYALFQVPGGFLGQKLGARHGFTLISLVAFAAMISTAVASYAVGGQALFVVLLLAQFLLGVAQGGIFPISAGVFESWFPPRHWPLVQGLQSMGLQIGAAMTPPLIASLMHAWSWQSALLFTTLPALLFIGAWAWYGRDTPRVHPSVQKEELEEIGDRSTEHAVPASGGRLLHLLTNRNVGLLFISYLCMNYTFYLLANWVFLYLIQERKFSILESGWLATVPPLAAALGAGLGGYLTSIACARLGARWGYRIIPLIVMPSAGLLLLVAVSTAHAYFAVFVMALCYCLVELTEGSYWASAMTIGHGDTMMVGGVMNTGGNLGGIIGIPIVGYLSGNQHWDVAFWIGAALAMVSALTWLGIDTTQRVDTPEGRQAREVAA